MINLLLYICAPVCVAVICLGLLSAQAEEATKDNMLPFKLVAQGIFPSKHTPLGRWAAGDLYGNGHELFVAEAERRNEGIPTPGGGTAGVGKAKLTAFRWPGMERVWQYPARYLENSPDLAVLGIAWAVGDTDDDGKEEILVFEGETLYRHEWGGKHFQSDTFLFPGVGIIDQAIVGNIDNAGANELITFSFSKTDVPKSSDEDVESFDQDLTLSIWQVSQNKYEILWQDSGELGYHITVWMPPDELVTVGDVENTGKNTLVVSHAQSDASPTHYDFLTWADTSLKLKRSIVLTDGKIWHYKDYYWPSGEPPKDQFWMLGSFHPVKRKNKTWLLGGSAGPRIQGYTDAIIHLENGNYVSLYVKLEGFSGGDLRDRRTLWLDPDGNGNGLLCFSDSLHLFFRPK